MVPNFWLGLVSSICLKWSTDTLIVNHKYVGDDQSSVPADGSQKAGVDRLCPDYKIETVSITIVIANHRACVLKTRACSALNWNQFTNAPLDCLIIRLHLENLDIMWVAGASHTIYSSDRSRGWYYWESVSIEA